MSATFADLIQQIRAETENAASAEPEGYNKLRTGRLESRPGCDSAYFGAFDIAHGMLRDFAMYTVYPALVIHRTHRDSRQTAIIVGEMFPTVVNYLGFSGFPELRKLGTAFAAAAKDFDADQMDEALSAFLRYVNTLYAWAYHYFLWDAADHMRYAEPEIHLEHPIADTLEPTNTLIKLRWEPLGIEVRAFLAVNHNSELCQEILAALPFTCLQTHPMAAGESLMAWSPLTSTAPTPFKEEIRKAPVGRLRFNARTGQKFIVQYGRTSEDIMAPVIGSVLEEDRHKLAEVGAEVRESTYRTKKEIWLTVERC